ncbi:MAG: DUF927 domain-containing protein, partial [Deltaproteobacteria bacterium]|nr:DUF927 domain-containing protein [Deltaproteobacteria bacterium]
MENQETIIPEQFTINNTGVWLISDDDKSPTRICSPLRILATTRDSNHDNHGILVEWHDADSHTHRLPLP